MPFREHHSYGGNNKRTRDSDSYNTDGLRKGRNNNVPSLKRRKIDNTNNNNTNNNNSNNTHNTNNKHNNNHHTNNETNTNNSQSTTENNISYRQHPMHLHSVTVNGFIDEKDPSIIHPLSRISTLRSKSRKDVHNEIVNTIRQNEFLKIASQALISHKAGTHHSQKK
eukprot:261146_1